MAVIRPFRALRFDSSRAGSLETLVCPPYDVVDEAKRSALMGLSPQNLIQVELPQEKPSIPATNGDYARAAATLKKWEEEGILLRDAKPALYPYSQSYAGPDGKRRERRGLLCALRVEDYDGGAVRPHEKTLPKPKEDRFKLLSATTTNVSPIFGLYADKDGTISEVLAKTVVNEPIAEFTDESGVEHRVWKLDDGELQGAVRSALAESRIYIADGHHRYETALRYRNARREDPVAPKHSKGAAPWDFTLACLTDVRDPGLAVFPIHRLAKLPEGMTAETLRERLERFFEVEELDDLDVKGDALVIGPRLEEEIRPLTRREPGAADTPAPVSRSSRAKLFALYSHRLEIAWRLRSKESLASFLLEVGTPKSVAALDVAALHRTILEEVLHASYADGTVHFAHSGAEAVKIAQGKGTGHGDTDGFDVAILCNATRVTDLVAVVDAGETMPQKSTYFYPKLATGLVMNRLDE